MTNLAPVRSLNVSLNPLGDRQTDTTRTDTSHDNHYGIHEKSNSNRGRAIPARVTTGSLPARVHRGAEVAVINVDDCRGDLRAEREHIAGRSIGLGLGNIASAGDDRGDTRKL